MTEYISGDGGLDYKAAPRSAAPHMAHVRSKDSLPYTPPSWASQPSMAYFLEVPRAHAVPSLAQVLKNGSIADKIDIGTKDRCAQRVYQRQSSHMRSQRAHAHSSHAHAHRYLMGRADVCDIVAEHASISRFHVRRQHGQNGASTGPALRTLTTGDVFVYDFGSTHGTKIG